VRVSVDDSTAVLLPEGLFGAVRPKIVAVGVNYKFSLGGPVVARY
jgi:hypothetical protein